MVATLTLTSTALARHRHAVDANGNSAGPGVVVSHKTGATAHVGWQYASRFQAYIDDVEARGAAVYFMGGIRRGHCSNSSLHPCGKALDTCQTSRGRVAAKCHLPSRYELGRIAAAHGLFEGGRWCNSDYGHAQVGETAAACGSHPTTMTASARSRRTVATAYAAPMYPDRMTAAY